MTNLVEDVAEALMEYIPSCPIPFDLSKDDDPTGCVWAKNFATIYAEVAIRAFMQSEEMQLVIASLRSIQHNSLVGFRIGEAAFPVTEVEFQRKFYCLHHANEQHATKALLAICDGEPHA